jgi:hypothetical protein
MTMSGAGPAAAEAEMETETETASENARPAMAMCFMCRPFEKDDFIGCYRMREAGKRSIPI